MRVPPVFPASDGQFCRESTLYEWWKKYRHGPERWGILFKVSNAKLL